MPIELTIAGNAIPTEPSSFGDLKAETELAFHLAESLASLLDSPLAAVPATVRSTSCTYTSPPVAFNPGPVQFGLQAGTGGTLQIVTSGDLVPYTGNLENPQLTAIQVPANTAYLKLTLLFNLSANAATAYSGGSFGVTAALDTAARYAITFCKAFPPSTPLRSAIQQIFASFVLPLHPDTLAHLTPGDYLLHEFDGNLNLAFGAYAGLDKILYAGQSSIDVLKTLGTPFASLSVQAQPEVSLAASLKLSVQYASRFEALLSRTGTTTARLHLFRSAHRSATAALKAGLTVSANAGATLTVNAQSVQDNLIRSIAPADSPARAAVAKVLSSASAATAIDKYVTEINDKLTGWLNRANGLETNLQVLIEQDKSRMVLAAYTFDLAAPQFPAAWNAAIAGDFAKALGTGAVTLDPGSGLEDAYRRKTSFSCNFFNLYQLTSWQQFSTEYSLVYAGNNVFHFAATVGLQTGAATLGAMHTLDFFFSASAGTTPTGTLTNPAISLHLDLTAQADPKASTAIAGMLSALHGGPICDALARDMRAFASTARTGTVQLKVTIPSAAFARILCDPCPGTTTANDAGNWSHFARAADDLAAWPLLQMSSVSAENLTFLKSFAGWQTLNIAQTGAFTPSRLEPGNIALWPEEFPQTDPGSRTLILYSMHAGQHFMNFCAALHDLATLTEPTAAALSYQSLLKLLAQALKQDTGVDFIRPCALATIRLCNAPITILSAPAAPAIPTDHFAVSLSL